MKTWLSLLLQGILLAVAVPAALGKQPVCAGPGAGSTVDRARIVDDDLVVEVRWSEKLSPGLVATIEVLDRDGVVAASKTVNAEAGETVAYPVTQGRTFFDQHGYWYAVRVAGAGGTLLTPETPVLVSFCRAEENCVYSVVDGVGADSVAMEDELARLLDELADRGSKDLLSDALRARPDLDYAVYWVADQLDRLGIDKGGACPCVWTVAYSQDPAKRSLARQTDDPASQGGPDWETVERLGPGTNFYLAGQVLGGPKRTLSATAEAGVRLYLRCRSVSGWTPVAWAGGVVRVPALAPCDRACADAEIAVTTTARTRTAANAWGTDHHGAYGSASTTASFFLNDQPDPALTLAAQAEADRPPGDDAQETVTGSPPDATGEWLVPGGDASAGYEVGGTVEICLQEYGPATACQGSFPRDPGADVPWAYGCAALATGATLVGEASCALERTRRASLQRIDIANTQDGLVIVPWNP